MAAAFSGRAEFAIAAEHAASSRNASVVTAPTAEQIISVVTATATDQPLAVAVALAVASESDQVPGRIAQPLRGPLWPTRPLSNSRET